MLLNKCKRLFFNGLSSLIQASKGELPVNSHLFNRRQFSLALTSFLSGLGLSASALASGGGPGSDEISRTEEAIHQEVVLKAGRKRVYEVLTEAGQFSKATGSEGAEIGREVGGTFSLFGGQIEGRHVELVPSARIVQAWRSSGWEKGKYSIARFELKDEGIGTKIVFDHTGFPRGAAEHLATGWKEHYWNSLARYFAS
jgi:activator of HSP90 ATPase